MRSLSRKVQLGQLHVLKGIFVKTFRIMSRYVGTWIMIMTLPYMISGLFVGIGHAVGGQNAQKNFYQNTGVSDPLLYSVLGGSIMLAAIIVLEEIGAVIREEQLIGTFELIYLTPNNTMLIWFYHIMPIATLMITVFSIDVTPILVWKGSMLSPLEWVIVAGVIFISMLPLVGIGLIIAALTVRFKEIWAVINVINSVITLLSGYYYPLEIFPSIVQAIAFVIPTSRGVQILKDIIAKRCIPTNMFEHITILLLLSIFYLCLGFITYRRWEYVAKRTGELSKY